MGRRGAGRTDNVDKFQMRLTGQQLLHVLRVLHARHLQKDLVRVLPPMTRQRWLGNADSVDATLDDLHRLISRRFAERDLCRPFQRPGNGVS